MSAAELFLADRVALHPGDCREVLRTMPDASIDSVVCDPPYALVSIGKRFGKPSSAPAAHGRDGLYARASAGFMGQAWDTGETAFAVEFWADVLRVLKPGGHVVAFSGTRTYHRMVVAIEDAGFDIRDQLAWVYGSGFPKSHDVAKGIDRHNGDERPVVGERKKLQSDGANEVFGSGPDKGGVQILTSAASAASAAWEGWGTALKPSWEPIVLARKPLAGTVAANVLEHGTGALNIDGCRVNFASDGDMAAAAAAAQRSCLDQNAGRTTYGRFDNGAASLGPYLERMDRGRWPANLIHDGSLEVVAAFPAAPGQMAAVRPDSGTGQKAGAILGAFAANSDCSPRGDTGSAARFFYSAKADAHDRVASKHPTVKPVDLMQWLCRLVTPPGGVVLDPFAGSGTTGEAAWREGFRAVLVEREATYCDDIRRRLRLAARPAERAAVAKAKGRVAEDHGPLFGGSEGA